MTIKGSKMEGMGGLIKKEISFGHIVVVVGLLISFGLVEIPNAGEYAIMRKQVELHEQTLKQQEQRLEKLSENQIIMTRLLDKLSILVELHMDSTTNGARYIK